MCLGWLPCCRLRLVKKIEYHGLRVEGDSLGGYDSQSCGGLSLYL